jgi:8-oxo-dGTP diphosphatase
MSSTDATKPIRHSVALVIRDPTGKFLAIKRADDDDSLPGVWGLPAASLCEGESDTDAVIRAGRAKLGVDIKPGTLVGTDRIDRGSYILELSDYEATILNGTPSVPQPDKSVSQYVDLQYTSNLSVLVEAARRGSLCSRVFLKSNNYTWE